MLTLGRDNVVGVKRVRVVGSMNVAGFLAPGEQRSSTNVMENEATFVAPEGVYSLTEEQKPPVIHTPVTPAPNGPIPARLSTVTVRFPTQKLASSQGLSSLLGGGKDGRLREKDKDKDKDKEKEKDKDSISSSEHSREEGTSDPQPDLSISPQVDTTAPKAAFPPSLFSTAPSLSGKKKSVSRPKHNLRTTSSTFVTRLQSAEGLHKTLQSKQGEVTFLFYNTSKSFFWSEPKAKVCS
jgi:catabolite repression protein CreC